MTAVSPTDLLSIGAVAARTGTSSSALRYYEQIGLIEATTRVSGQRRFTDATVGRVRFVQGCQEAGFTLVEIGAILDDSAGEWRQVVDAKLETLIERRAHLELMIETLTEIRECGCEAVADCPVALPTGAVE